MPRVKYVGSPSPLFDMPEKTHQMIVAGRIALTEGRVPDPRKGEWTEAHVWEAERRRHGGPKPGGGNYPVTVCIPGTTIRFLGPSEGLSVMVKWGPEAYELIQYVSDSDWRVIQGLPEAHHFKLVED